MKWRKHNQRRPDDFELTLRDGFSRRKIDQEIGSLEKVMKNTLKRLDEKYNLAWDKILPKGLIKYGRKRKRS